MKVVIVWITGMFMMAAITIGWYATLPIVLGISRAAGAIPLADANFTSHVNLIEIVEYAWGPVFILVILLWMIVYGHKVDVQGQYV